MNLKLPNNGAAIIGFIVVLVLGGGYLFFFSTPADAPLSETNVAGNEAEQRFASLVTQLTSISFDTRIFSDPRFGALTDMTTPVTPEAAGRADPFAPFPGASRTTTGP
ncbi:MAG: hypothetical protein WDN10_04355 [bacterium]